MAALLGAVLSNVVPVFSSIIKVVSFVNDQHDPRQEGIFDHSFLSVDLRRFAVHDVSVSETSRRWCWTAILRATVRRLIVGRVLVPVLLVIVPEYGVSSSRAQQEQIMRRVAAHQEQISLIARSCVLVERLARRMIGREFLQLQERKMPSIIKNFTSLTKFRKKSKSSISRRL